MVAAVVDAAEARVCVLGVGGDAVERRVKLQVDVLCLQEVGAGEVLLGDVGEVGQRYQVSLRGNQIRVVFRA